MIVFLRRELEDFVQRLDGCGLDQALRNVQPDLGDQRRTNAGPSLRAVP